MEIIAKQLIFHGYDEEYLKKNCSPNTLKDENLEWNKEENKNHPYAEDIVNNDIIFSIRDIDKKEDYAFIFFKKQSLDKIFLFTITKVVLDKNLPESYIRVIIKNCLTVLVNGNYLRNDRIIAKDNYPFYEPGVSDTIDKVSDEILPLFRTSKNGVVDLSPEQIERIKNTFNRNAPID